PNRRHSVAACPNLSQTAPPANPSCVSQAPLRPAPPPLRPPYRPIVLRQLRAWCARRQNPVPIATPREAPLPTPAIFLAASKPFPAYKTLPRNRVSREWPREAQSPQLQNHLAATA